MYEEVFSTGARLLREASAVLGISTTPKPGYIPAAVNSSQWARTEVVKVPKDLNITNTQVGDNRDYALIFASGAGLASVVDAKPTSPVSGNYL